MKWDLSWKENENYFVQEEIIQCIFNLEGKKSVSQGDREERMLARIWRCPCSAWRDPGERRSFLMRCPLMISSSSGLFILLHLDFPTLIEASGQVVDVIRSPKIFLSVALVITLAALTTKLEQSRIGWTTAGHCALAISTSTKSTIGAGVSCTAETWPWAPELRPPNTLSTGLMLGAERPVLWQ